MASYQRDVRDFEMLHERLHKFGSPDFYQGLGVPRSADEKHIQAEYRKWVLRCHPDIRNPNKPKDAEERLVVINQVYGILSDPVKRASYDSWLGLVGSQRAAAPPAGNPGSYGDATGAGPRHSGRSGSSRVFVNGVEILIGETAGRGIFVSNVHVYASGSVRSEGGLESEINEGYEGVSVVNVSYMGDLHLGLSDDTRVYVNGITSKSPNFSGGKLTIEGRIGEVLLPRSQQHVKLHVKSDMGTVTGKVAHTGKIEVKIGNVNLKIHAPLEVIAEAELGFGSGRYYPPWGKPSGSLVVNVKAGSIGIYYA